MIELVVVQDVVVVGLLYLRLDKRTHQSVGRTIVRLDSDCSRVGHGQFGSGSLEQIRHTGFKTFDLLKPQVGQITTTIHFLTKNVVELCA